MVTPTPGPKHWKYECGELYQADALEVAAELAPASVRLVYCDGPYGLGFGEWDRATGRELAAWYEPHVIEWERICQPSASIVAWGTSESLARVRCLIEDRPGWRPAGSIIWSKPSAATFQQSPEQVRTWPRTHEAAAIFCRDELKGKNLTFSAFLSEQDEYRNANWIQRWLYDEWITGAELTPAAAEAVVGSTSRHYFTPSQWSLPTFDKFRRLAAAAAEHGNKLPANRTGRPWLIHAAASSSLRDSHDYLAAAVESLGARFAHLITRFDQLRAPFELAAICPSVITELSGSSDTVGNFGSCRKPTNITRLFLETLTRPGELIFEPFGGSAPAARVCEAFPEDHRRRWISCETDGAVVALARELLERVQGFLL